MWQVIGATSEGTSHLRTNTPNQDSHGFYQYKDIVIASVADGLGSATKSNEGSQLAVKTVLDALRESIYDPPSNLDEWVNKFSCAFNEARSKIEKVANSNNLPIREYGTTLILVAATPECLVVGHIGDGAVVALLHDDSLETVSKPMRGEYANQVTPLTANDALVHLRLFAQNLSVKALALFSDGLQNLSLEEATGKPFAPFFNPFFELIAQKIDAIEASVKLEEFLKSERVCLRTDDDKTLVVIGKVIS